MTPEASRPRQSQSWGPPRAPRWVLVALLLWVVLMASAILGPRPVGAWQRRMLWAIGALMLATLAYVVFAFLYHLVRDRHYRRHAAPDGTPEEVAGLAEDDSSGQLGEPLAKRGEPGQDA